MNPPRHWVPDVLYDVSEQALSMAARAVYGALCRCVTKGAAKPSVARLARMVAAHRTTVMDALDDLEKAGMVITTRRFGAASRYVLTGVEQWKVPMTSRSQRPVEAHSRTETGRRESQNQSVRTAEPVSQGDTLGSTAGRTAGKEAVAVADSKQDTAEENRRLAAAARAEVTRLVGTTAGRLDAGRGRRDLSEPSA